MVHVVFDSSSIHLNDFIQSGGGISYFQGFPPYHVSGAIRQRGYGVGGIIKTIWRYILPQIKNVGKTAGVEGLSTASRILENLARGSDLRNTVINEAKTGLSKPQRLMRSRLVAAIKGVVTKGASLLILERLLEGRVN